MLERGSPHNFCEIKKGSYIGHVWEPLLHSTQDAYLLQNDVKIFNELTDRVLYFSYVSKTYKMISKQVVVVSFRTVAIFLLCIFFAV
jgi:hypothetical protein